MVSTLDFESSDPSSNLGGTSGFYENAANEAAGGRAQNVQDLPKKHNVQDNYTTFEC